MDSVLEKVTLYDILGYLVPGSVFLLIILYGMNIDDMEGILKLWCKYEGAFVVFGILIGYVMGIVLSEVTEWILFLFHSLLPEKLKTNKGWLKKEMLQAQIVEALIMAGISKDKKEITTQISKGDVKEYMQYMYGIIQHSEDGRRIHNYASAFVLYKNLAAAIIIGGVIVYTNAQNSSIGLLVSCICIGILLIVRSWRFKWKKDKYTVIWFIDKYRG